MVAGNQIDPTLEKRCFGLRRTVAIGKIDRDPDPSPDAGLVEHFPNRQVRMRPEIPMDFDELVIIGCSHDVLHTIFSFVSQLTKSGTSLVIPDSLAIASESRNPGGDGSGFLASAGMTIAHSSLFIEHLKRTAIVTSVSLYSSIL